MMNETNTPTSSPTLIVRLLLCLIGGIIGAALGIMTGLYMGVFGNKSPEVAIIAGILCATLMIILIKNATAFEISKMAIGLVVGFIFGVFWEKISNAPQFELLGQASNWAFYGVIASQTTRETFDKVKR